jgi:hypothetical protein
MSVFVEHDGGRSGSAIYPTLKRRWIQRGRIRCKMVGDCAVRAVSVAALGVAELRGTAAAIVEVTLQGLIQHAEQVRAAAFAAKQFPAAIAAIKELGVLTGLRVERKEKGLPGEFADLENMTSDELRKFIVSEYARLGLGNASGGDGDRAGSGALR